VFLLALALAFATPRASAFTLTPMIASFDPSGPGATRAFEVTNDGDTSIPVELSIVPRAVDENGGEVFEKSPDIDKIFSVFPPQLLLKSKEKRTVRVTWTGDGAPPRELAYRLLAEQLPVETEKKAGAKSGALIHVLLRYAGAIYVTPKDARAKVEVRSVALTPAAAQASAKTPRQLELVLENTGTAHLVLDRFSLVLGPRSPSIPEGAPGNELSLGPDALPKLAGQNLLPGGRRRFLLPLPKELATATTLHARLELPE
jgi:fimbrial chaperone protein